MVESNWWIHSKNPVLGTVLSYLLDADLVHFLCVNRATILYFSHFPIQQTRFYHYSGNDRIPDPSNPGDTAYSIGSICIHWETLKRMPYPLHNSICIPCIYHLQLDNINLLHHFRHLRSLWLNFPKSSAQFIDNLLPVTLLDLTLVNYFLPLTIKSFPPSLITLCLASQPYYEESQRHGTLDTGVLPQTLQALSLYCYLTTPIVSSTVLPPSLKLLIYDDEDDLVPLLPHSLPSSLQQLVIGVVFMYHTSLKFVLPSGLRKLTIGSNFFGHIDADDLPDSLEELKFEFLYQSVAGILPYGLQLLIVSDGFGDPFKSLFHPLHHTLQILKCFNQDYDEWTPPDTFPITLTTLWLTTENLCDYRFRRDVLPPNLTELHLDTGAPELFTMDTFSSCPKLEVLSIGSYDFTQVFEQGMLPGCLRELMLPRNYSQQVQSDSLPDSLRRLLLSADLLQGSIPEHLAIEDSPWRQFTTDEC